MHEVTELANHLVPIGSMYAIYGNIYHQYIPNVSIYTIHGSYGVGNNFLLSSLTCCQIHQLAKALASCCMTGR